MLTSSIVPAHQDASPRRAFRVGRTNHRGTEDTEERHRELGGESRRSPSANVEKRSGTPIPFRFLTRANIPINPSVFITLCPLCLCGSFLSVTNPPAPFFVKDRAQALSGRAGGTSC